MKLSIITINYNNVEGLQKTIDSVLCQTWKDFEWIFIDGGSTDGSKELIEKTAAECPNVSFWCSEPDKGVYNAMNKGILHANGEYLQFLNSGDCLSSNNVIEHFLRLQLQEDIITGNIRIDGDPSNIRETVYEGNLDYEYMVNYTILHPSSFIKKELFHSYGMYDENLKIVSDWKFFLECTIKHNCSYIKWNKVIVDFNTHGISENPNYSLQIEEERRKVLDAFLPYVRRTYIKKQQEIQDLGLKRRIKRSTVDRLKSSIRTILSMPCRLYLKIKSTSRRHVTAEEKIIISMTSWKKRICNVKTVIDSIYANTTKPDKVVLNLSLEEFPNKIEDLPAELAQLEHDNLLEIVWNEGNTKAFKKFIPTIKKYPDDIIITIDDDFIYPTDFIETFVTAHKKNPNHPLNGNVFKFFGVNSHCGCASLVKREYFGPYIDTLMDNQVIKFGYDDIFYTFCVTLNGLKYKYVNKPFFYNMEPNNPLEGLSQSSEKTFDEMKNYLVEKIKKRYHINMSVLSKPLFWI